MEMVPLSERAAHISRLFAPSLNDRLTPPKCLCEHLGKQKKVALSLLSPGGRRPMNSCCLAVHSNLKALLQTWWFTAGLKQKVQPSARVIRKQVESGEFGCVMPERWPQRNCHWWWLFQISKGEKMQRTEITVFSFIHQLYQMCLYFTSGKNGGI